jgi:CRP/FNR family cyclic AMP-dependent transcriptional regulator
MSPAPAPSPGTFAALLTAEELGLLHELGIERRFEKGAILIYQHEPDDRVMLLLDGRVKVEQDLKNERGLLLSIRDPGDVLGELGFIDGEPRVATVTALEPARALVIPGGAFRRHLETTPRVAVVLLGVVARRFREATVKRSQLAASDTMGRVVARVLELADRYGDETGNGVEVISPLSHEELAGWTGASRAGVAQALAMLRELGWLETDRRSFLLRDVESLRARAA